LNLSRAGGGCFWHEAEAKERSIVVNLTHMGDVDVPIACVVSGVIRNKDEALWISPLKLHQHQRLAF
jgi:hypothetical protein